IENLTTPINRPIEIWTGTGCNTDNTTQRAADCHKVGVTSNVSAIAAAGFEDFEIPLFDLMVPKDSDRPGCQERGQDGTTWAMVDADGDGVLEYSVSDTIKTDTKPPPLPINFRAVGAEKAIELSWDAPPDGVADVAFYQALCATTLSGAPASS